MVKEEHFQNGFESVLYGSKCFYLKQSQTSTRPMHSLNQCSTKDYCCEAFIHCTSFKRVFHNDNALFYIQM